MFNWNPFVNHLPEASSEEEYDSPQEDPNLLVSPRRPPQSPSVSPRRLLHPDPPPVPEVLAAAGRQLREFPGRRERLEERIANHVPRVPRPPPQPPVMPDPPAVIISFEDEDGVDDNRALQEACRNVERVEWDDNDIKFFFAKVEIKMSAVGVRKQYTKFQVLSTVLPKKIEDEVKGLLVMTEAEFPQKDAYKQLKTEILRIFGPKPEDAVERALNRVLTDKPSTLARGLVNDLCKQKVKLDCPCCPAIVTALWKRQLGSNVRAGIASKKLTKDNFNEITQEADDIHGEARPVGSVAAVRAGVQSAADAGSTPSLLDTTQPGLQYPVPEVNAVRNNGWRGGRGRGGRNNRGGRGGNNRGGGNQSNSNSNSNNGQSGSGSQPRPKGAKHPDLPAGEWSGCSNHFKFGRSAYFCGEPATCPWKNVFITRPSK